MGGGAGGGAPALKPDGTKDELEMKDKGAVVPKVYGGCYEKVEQNSWPHKNYSTDEGAKFVNGSLPWTSMSWSTMKEAPKKKKKKDGKPDMSGMCAASCDVETMFCPKDPLEKPCFFEVACLEEKDAPETCVFTDSLESDTKALAEYAGKKTASQNFELCSEVYESTKFGKIRQTDGDFGEDGLPDQVLTSGLEIEYGGLELKPGLKGSTPVLVVTRGYREMKVTTHPIEIWDENPVEIETLQCGSSARGPVKTVTEDKIKRVHYVRERNIVRCREEEVQVIPVSQLVSITCEGKNETNMRQKYERTATQHDAHHKTWRLEQRKPLKWTQEQTEAKPCCENLCNCCDFCKDCNCNCNLRCICCCPFWFCSWIPRYCNWFCNLCKCCCKPCHCEKVHKIYTYMVSGEDALESKWEQSVDEEMTIDGMDFDQVAMVKHAPITVKMIIRYTRFGWGNYIGRDDTRNVHQPLPKSLVEYNDFPMTEKHAKGLDKGQMVDEIVLSLDVTLSDDVTKLGEDTDVWTTTEQLKSFIIAITYLRNNNAEMSPELFAEATKDVRLEYLPVLGSAFTGAGDQGALKAGWVERDGCTPLDIKKPSSDERFSMEQLRHAGFTAKELRKEGFPAALLFTGGYTAYELKAAGYSTADIAAVEKEGEGAGYNPALLRAAYLNVGDNKMEVEELKEAGYTASRLLGKDFKKTATGDCTWSSNNGYTAKELKGVYDGTMLKGMYPLAELKEAGFPAGELYGGEGSLGEKNVLVEYEMDPPSVFSYGEQTTQKAWADATEEEKAKHRAQDKIRKEMGANADFTKCEESDDEDCVYECKLPKAPPLNPNPTAADVEAFMGMFATYQNELAVAKEKRLEELKAFKKAKREAEAAGEAAVEATKAAAAEKMAATPSKEAADEAPEGGGKA